jgi:phosphoenolpyruvate---glycerone phosphotransferase subunit DhaL
MTMDGADAKDLAPGVFGAIARAFEEGRDLLTRLDSDIGDGDLGLTMEQGFRAALAAVEAADGNSAPSELVVEAGMAMGEAVPSTMGTLLSIGLVRAGAALRNASRLSGSPRIDGHLVQAVLAAAAEGIAARGGAKRGDKTLLDALFPAAEAAGRAAEAPGGADPRPCLRAAAAAARAGVEETRAMPSIHGKAGVFGESSIGKQDPGAMAIAILLGAMADWAGSRLENGEGERLS